MVDVDGNDVQSDVACRYQNLLTDSAPSSQNLDDSIEALNHSIVTDTEESLQGIQIGSLSIDENHVPDLPENFEDDVDTSWDSITSKFQEAREAMHVIQSGLSSNSQTQLNVQEEAFPTSSYAAITQDLGSNVEERQVNEPLVFGSIATEGFWTCECGAFTSSRTAGICPICGRQLFLKKTETTAVLESTPPQSTSQTKETLIPFHTVSDTVQPWKKDPMVWYCSECRDGPYGDWQLSCQNCHHLK
jgi:hypothetical protein